MVILPAPPSRWCNHCSPARWSDISHAPAGTIAAAGIRIRLYTDTTPPSRSCRGVRFWTCCRPPRGTSRCMVARRRRRPRSCAWRYVGDHDEHVVMVGIRGRACALLVAAAAWESVLDDISMVTVGQIIDASVVTV